MTCLLELCSDPPDTVQIMHIYCWGESGLGYLALFHFTEFVMVGLDCANLKKNCHICHSGKIREEQQKVDVPNYPKKISLKPAIRWYSYYPIRETEGGIREMLSLEADCRISCPQIKLLWANSLAVDGSAAGFWSRWRQMWEKTKLLNAYIELVGENLLLFKFHLCYCYVVHDREYILIVTYNITPLIRINWDG